MKSFAVFAASVALSASSAWAETVTSFTTLVDENSGRVILETEILEDGEVVFLISKKNSEVPEYICEIHRQKSKSYNDACRKIGS